MALLVDAGQHEPQRVEALNPRPLVARFVQRAALIPHLNSHSYDPARCLWRSRRLLMNRRCFGRGCRGCRGCSCAGRGCAGRGAGRGAGQPGVAHQLQPGARAQRAKRAACVQDVLRHRPLYRLPPAATASPAAPLESRRALERAERCCCSAAGGPALLCHQRRRPRLRRLLSLVELSNAPSGAAAAAHQRRRPRLRRLSSLVELSNAPSGAAALLLAALLCSATSGDGLACGAS
jgi:hypothetical protein